ncbi:MAG: hypothetical protein RIS44_289 [Pseudomonadota bacterium]|jgi:hypothetical protein
MEELLDRVQSPAVDTESYDDYPTAQEEEEAYAIPRRIVQSVQRQEPRAELAGCVPALWERWHVERSCRDRGRRSRFAGR